jgi:hypothetical protein
MTGEGDYLAAGRRLSTAAIRYPGRTAAHAAEIILKLTLKTTLKLLAFSSGASDTLTAVSA